MKKMLVVEDEKDIRAFIVINLKRAGFGVLEAGSGEEALALWEEHAGIDIALLDVMLPGIDGFTLCRKLREQDATLGIIMLTARGQEMDKVSGFARGADDYVVKPFSPVELLARIDALLRRVELVKKPGKREITHSPFLLDLEGLRLFKNGIEIELTQTEYALIRLFLENPGKALSRDYILDAVWGQDYFGNYKTVDVNIRRLRAKVEDDSSNPTYIHTVWGYGYRFGKEEGH